jgi:uncharacterized protein (TIGR02246 family)
METEDVRLIERVVVELERAWNAGDSAAFAAPFADDVDFVNVLGDHFRGRALVAAGHRRIFYTIYKGSRLTYEIENIRFPRADVAVVFTRARLMSRVGAAVDDPRRAERRDGTMGEAQSRTTMVLTKESGEWRIEAFQNTKVAEAS